MKDLGLSERYDRARSDPKLTDLRDEIALVDTRMQSLLDGLQESDTSGTWDTVKDLIEQRRKLVDTVQKSEQRLDFGVPVDQVYAFMQRIVGLVTSTFSDKQEVARFLEGLRQLVGRARTIDAIATSTE